LDPELNVPREEESQNHNTLNIDSEGRRLESIGEARNTPEYLVNNIYIIIKAEKSHPRQKFVGRSSDSRTIPGTSAKSIDLQGCEDRKAIP
jgi:hypothetical protein